MNDANVTPIHREPTIPNPLISNPWAALTDDQVREGIDRTRARIDAAEYTLRALMRESARRHGPTESGSGHE